MNKRNTIKTTSSPRMPTYGYQRNNKFGLRMGFRRAS